MPVYDKTRYPKQLRRPDGTWGCRGCGGPLPPRRRSWCSDACYERYEPGQVLIAAHKRDHHICCCCKTDLKAAREALLVQLHAAEDAEGKWRDPSAHRRYLYQQLRMVSAEVDHIKPISQGGLTVLENLRTLCRRCHITVTTNWSRSKTRAKGK